MTVESALGSRFFLDGYDISGDVGQIGAVRLTNSPIDISNITESGHRRLSGRKSGEMSWNVFFNDAASQEHAILKAINRTDRLAGWAHRCAAIGDSGIAMRGKQMNYDWNLGADGGLVGAVQMLSNGAPIEQGVLITPGKRTDTGATNGSSHNFGAATAFGLGAYVFLTAFDGTDITIALEDSANNSSFAAITGGSFGEFTAVGAGRIQTAVDGAVRQYTRVVTTTSAGFNSATFVVFLTRYHVTQPLYS